ncbi:uncharacterized protein PITG_11871 [Phytophthora infestans T30-4]|uniref:Uncharacterized protein n=1 Tax=Phytophthora infestans (strain T30-4) TaxID=403677 RepID=D0NHF6_PHYIT|nr:uncharacterized protein PITG_11871 [Phytophthora infestans T30-4]EEY58881.1 hypothetical protein PITG_11871 [Phytophthora infestans T30-4]|eukprot:XP_002901354.1 hypothetical protein PITG_11871 [Phytophthora infestans T30-4]
MPRQLAALVYVYSLTSVSQCLVNSPHSCTSTRSRPPRTRHLCLTAQVPN